MKFSKDMFTNLIEL
uniref:Uncharacterized protein n=1 Tax=Anguilla anguilla TaxID=7936 RepID=A0A0E9RT04_ANGAN